MVDETDWLAEPGEGVVMGEVPADVIAAKDRFPGWDVIALHVAAVTALSNLGKMLPALVYRDRAVRERIALSLAMFPRGEVGAGVLVVALANGIEGPVVVVATLSLLANLMGTGLIIGLVAKLTGSSTCGPRTMSTGWSC